MPLTPPGAGVLYSPRRQSIPVRERPYNTNYTSSRLATLQARRGLAQLPPIDTRVANRTQPANTSSALSPCATLPSTSPS